MDLTIEAAEAIVDWTVTAVFAGIATCLFYHHPEAIPIAAVTCGSAYFAKVARYQLDRWKGVITLDPDSGRLTSRQLFLRREAPSVILTPKKHFFGPWWAVVAQFDNETGSMSITRYSMKDIKKEDYRRRSFGTREVCSQQAYNHLVELDSRLRKQYEPLDDIDRDLLIFTRALINAGIQPKEND